MRTACRVRRLNPVARSLIAMACASVFAASHVTGEPRPCITAARYTVTPIAPDESRAYLSVHLEVTSPASGWQPLRLMQEPGILRNFTAADDGIRLERRGDILWLHVRGRTSLELEYIVEVSREGPLKWLDVPLAASAASRLEFTSRSGEYSVGADPHAPVECDARDGTTVAVIVPTGGERLRISWVPRARRDERENLLDAEEVSSFAIRSGYARRESRLAVRAKWAVPDVVALDLPPEVQVLGVWVRTSPRAIARAVAEAGGPHDPTHGVTLPADWRLEEGAETHVAHVFMPSTAGNWAEILVSSEQVADDGRVITLRPFSVRGAGRQSGVFKVAPQAGLTVPEISSPGMRRATADETGALAFEYRDVTANLRLRCEPVQAAVSVHVEQFVRLQADLAEFTGRATFDIRGAPIRDLEFDLDEGVTVLDVSGNGIETWNASDGRLRVRLREYRSGKCSLEVHGVQPLQTMNGTVVPLLRCPEADGFSGAIGISAGEDVALTHDMAKRLTQVDVEQLPEWIRAQRPKLGYTFDRPGAMLVVSTSVLRPVLNVEGAAWAVVREDTVREDYLLECIVERRPLFAMRLRLPEGLSPSSVKGEAVSDWEFSPAESIVSVTFKGGLVGRTVLRLYCERRRDGDEITLGGVTVLDADAIAGWFGIRTQGNLDLRPEAEVGVAPDDVRRLPAAFRGRPTVRLAYRWRGPEWGVRFRVIPRTPRMTAETRTTLLFGSSHLKVRSDIAWSISNASVGTLLLSLPSGALSVQAAGENLLSSEPDGNLLRLHLARPVGGTYSVAVTYELLPAADGAIVFQGVRLPNIERQGGTIAAYRSDPQVEVVVERLTDVARAENTVATDLGGFPFIGAFEYGNEEHEIVFRLRGHRLAEGGGLTVRHCFLTTTIEAEGKAFTRLVCRLENVGRQFLRLRLPERAELWTVSVGGEVTRPVRGNANELLVPLLDAPRNKPFVTEVVWLEPVQPMGLGGSLSLLSPGLDAPVEQVDWQVRVPEGYELVHAGGNMEFAQRDLWRRQGAIAIVLRALDAVGRFLRPLVPWFIGLAVSLGGAGSIYLLVRWILRRRRRRAETAVTRPSRRLPFVPSLVAVLLALCTILATVIFLKTALSRAREEARRKSSASNISQILKALMLYKETNDRYPDSLDELYPAYLDDMRILRSPVSGEQYAYRRPEGTAADLPVVWEEIGTGDGANVGFLDGRVQLLGRRRRPGAEAFITGSALPTEEVTRQAAEEKATEFFDLEKDKKARAARVAAQEKYDRAMQLAQSYLRRGEIVQAEEHLKMALSVRPEEEEAQAELRSLREAQAAAGGEATAAPAGARAEEKATERIPVGAIRALLDQFRRTGAESGPVEVVAERERVILDLLSGTRDRAEIEGGEVRIDDALLIVSGRATEVAAWRDAVSRLRDAILERSRSQTLARKQAEAEADAHRIAAKRQRAADEALRKGGRMGLGTVAGNRAAGARPVALESIPVADTRACEFHIPYGGMTRARVRLVCLRAGTALVVQAGLLCLAGAIATAFSLRRPARSLVILIVVAGLLLFAVNMADAASKGYLVMVFAGVAIAAAAVALRKSLRYVVR